MFYKAIIIGASTGGPSALRAILKQLPEQFPIPIIIVQRIPPGLFAESLAEALDEASPLKVRILKENDSINSNEAVLIPGGFNISFADNKITMIKGDDAENTPSISYTINQCISHFKEPLIFSILTGICLDNDLIQAVQFIKEQKGYVLAQNPESCFIGDLPQTIIQAGLANDVVNLEKISQSLIQLQQK